MCVCVCISSSGECPQLLKGRLKGTGSKQHPSPDEQMLPTDEDDMSF